VAKQIHVVGAAIGMDGRIMCAQRGHKGNRKAGEKW
jgi:hypothetical protein